VTAIDTNLGPTEAAANRELRGTLLAEPTARLAERAAALRDRGHGELVTYSRKVFIPLTKLCRDVCGYCTFAETPRPRRNAFLAPADVLEIAKAGVAAGCHEALFTLGDKPELRYRAAREALARLGYDSTIAYLAAMCQRVLRETGLLPHVNPGVMSGADIALLRRHSVSQGLMLESSAERLCGPGEVHFGSPDKHPTARWATIRAAGEQRVPFTTGILIGIGETRGERLDALFALRDLHARYGHIQEIIVQNFRAKPGTRMASAAEPDLDELRWTIAAARLILGAEMNIQCPPNLSPGKAEELIAAGINDWGGVSPVTPDHVNPEAPWPHIDALAQAAARAGKLLMPRLAAYPAYCRNAESWMAPEIATRVRRAVDADGFARTDSWAPGTKAAPPDSTVAEPAHRPRCGTGDLDCILNRTMSGTGLAESEIAALFGARGGAFDAVCRAADALRQTSVGDVVHYVVNRNINYTNICTYRCQFCAFSKGRGRTQLRGRAYTLDLDEIARRAEEAWRRGATEVCLQGGIHPDYTGQTYLDICRTIRVAAPRLHIHAFSPLEVTHGAASLGVSVPAFLARLKDAGLDTLPGTAAEILDDEVRRVLCPDKLTTQEWLSVVEAAHQLGLRTTATIMFGHIDAPRHWARHLFAIRELQERTGGFTEFVPLPFVHMEAPIYLRGLARRGPTWRETLLMHAVARLALHPVIPHVQVSWVKMGERGAAACLASGADDLGGTLMNEIISRAAGADHGQELAPGRMEDLIRTAGRVPRQRTTLYGAVPAERREASFRAAPLGGISATQQAMGDAAIAEKGEGPPATGPA